MLLTPQGFACTSLAIHYVLDDRLLLRPFKFAVNYGHVPRVGMHYISRGERETARRKV